MTSETDLDSPASIAAEPLEPEDAAGGAVPTSLLVRVLAALLFIIAVAQWASFAFSIFAGRSGYYDFSGYFDAALALHDNVHANIYDIHVIEAAAQAHHAFLAPGYRELYPPTIALLVLPLTLFSFLTATRIWFFLNVLLWLGSAVLMGELISSALAGFKLAAHPDSARPGAPHLRLRDWLSTLSPRATFVIGLAAFLCLTPFPLDLGLQLGQVNVLILFLTLLALWLARGRRLALAGAVLALAASIKILPAIIIIYFLLRGRWRVVAGALAGFAGVLVVMLAVMGVSGVLAMRAIVGGSATASLLYHNQSLARVPMWIGFELGFRPSTLTFLLGDVLLALVLLGFGAGVLIVVRASHRREPAPVDPASAFGVQDVLGFGWAAATMLLISPVVWGHYFAWLLPSCAICIGYLLYRLRAGLRASDGRLRVEVWLALATLVGFALAMANLPFDYDGIITDYLGPHVLHLSVRPFFMMERPAGTVLIWCVAGALFLIHAREAARAHPA